MKNNIIKETEALFTFSKSTRKWQIPVLAGISTGVPLLMGFYLDNLHYGQIAGLGGLVVLYIPGRGTVTHKMITVLLCSFGFMISYAIGQLLSFDPIVAVCAFGIFSLIVHGIILHYKTSPPRSFFFILIASISISQPFDMETAPADIGWLALGTMFTSILAAVYIVFVKDKDNPKETEPSIPDTVPDSWEALIMGLFMAIALGIGYLLDFTNPYWIPASSAAVMQGASLHYIWQRSFQRVLGTFLGLILCWLILGMVNDLMTIIVVIILLRIIVEFLVVRHYALAVIFITPMAILLTETTAPLVQDPNAIMILRFWQICIGSALGILGGWMLHKEKIRYLTIKGINRLENEWRR